MYFAMEGGSSSKRHVNLANHRLLRYNKSEVKREMKIAGIIAEYNPFHRGHARHIAETRRKTGCDYVVVCMDGAFTQRGEAACLDLHTRAKMALMCGADAVFLLPAMYAVRTADVFASGGAAILGGLGCDMLSFGSETVDIALLRKLAHLRENEPVEISAAIQQKLALGMSHARARGEVLSQYLGVSEEIISAPNAILGSEYIRAVEKLNLDMEIVAIERIGAYHDEELHEFASASAIRKAMKADKIAAAEFVPEEVRRFVQNAPEMHEPDDLLLHRLRSMREDEIAALPDVNEGLECRIKKCAQTAAGRSELIEAVKCKRYTHARLSRLCAHALLGLTEEMAKRHPLPEYAYLVGMRSDARPLLAELSARSKLPIASSPIEGDEVFDLECRSADLRALMCGDAEHRRAGQMYTNKFVRI